MNCKHEWRQYKSNTVCVKCNQHIINVLADQEKYADLGKLAISADVCGVDFNVDGCLGVNKMLNCSDYNFCKKRAEILEEINNETN